MRHTLPALALLLALASDSFGQGPNPIRLQFGTGKVRAGFTPVAKPDEYTRAVGLGFEKGADLRFGEGGCSSSKPFFFSVALPPGNYHVMAELGDGGAESTVTVKAELRRLMLENVPVEKGKTVRREFIVNVRTPAIRRGGKVGLKAPRETVDEAWAWDDELTLEFNGARPSVAALEIERVEVPTVFILGDSTVCDQSREPYASWGQMLPRFFKPAVAVSNQAESGESLRSFEGAGRYAKVIGDMKRGDTILIQFGHNDMKATEANAAKTYKATLKRWIGEVKLRGGTPVLIAPVNRHSFAGETVTNSLGEYPEMVREAAKEEDAALIDLNAMSKTLYEALGNKGSIQAFKHDADGKFDGTHHSPYGAYLLAKCVAKGIIDAKLDLTKNLVDEIKAFNPAKPLPVAEFKVPASPGFTNKRPLGDS